ncbi:unnamed protein product [Amoebophrya sp. A120]|nr:unnamed protein product [Amoebophrya sp. A120]|eukprot:GSA120T00002777001.1
MYSGWVWESGGRKNKGGMSAPEPKAAPAYRRIKLNTSQIRFTQQTISRDFTDKKFGPIQNLIDKLKSASPKDPDTVLKGNILEVARHPSAAPGSEPVYYALTNRRALAYIVARPGEEVNAKELVDEHKLQHEFQFRFSSVSDGLFITLTDKGHKTNLQQRFGNTSVYERFVPLHPYDGPAVSDKIGDLVKRYHLVDFSLTQHLPGKNFDTFCVQRPTLPGPAAKHSQELPGGQVGDLVAHIVGRTEQEVSACGSLLYEAYSRRRMEAGPSRAAALVDALRPEHVGGVQPLTLATVAALSAEPEHSTTGVAASLFSSTRATGSHGRNGFLGEDIDASCSGTEAGTKRRRLSLTTASHQVGNSRRTSPTSCDRVLPFPYIAPGLHGMRPPQRTTSTSAQQYVPRNALPKKNWKVARTGVVMRSSKCLSSKQLGVLAEGQTVEQMGPVEFEFGEFESGCDGFVKRMPIRLPANRLPVGCGSSTAKPPTWTVFGELAAAEAEILWEELEKEHVPATRKLVEVKTFLKNREQNEDARVAEGGKIGDALVRRFARIVGERSAKTILDWCLHLVRDIRQASKEMEPGPLSEGKSGKRGEPLLPHTLGWVTLSAENAGGPKYFVEVPGGEKGAESPTRGRSTSRRRRRSAQARKPARRNSAPSSSSRSLSRVRASVPISSDEDYYGRRVRGVESRSGRRGEKRRRRSNASRQRRHYSRSRVSSSSSSPQRRRTPRAKKKKKEKRRHRNRKKEKKARAINKSRARSSSPESDGIKFGQCVGGGEYRPGRPAAASIEDLETPRAFPSATSNATPSEDITPLGEDHAAAKSLPAEQQLTTEAESISTKAEFDNARSCVDEYRENCGGFTDLLDVAERAARRLEGPASRNDAQMRISRTSTLMADIQGISDRLHDLHREMSTAVAFLTCGKDTAEESFEQLKADFLTFDQEFQAQAVRTSQIISALDEGIKKLREM